MLKVILVGLGFALLHGLCKLQHIEAGNMINVPFIRAVGVLCNPQFMILASHGNFFSYKWPLINMLIGDIIHIKLEFEHVGF